MSGKGAEDFLTTILLQLHTVSHNMGSTVSSSMIKVSLKDKGIKDIDVDVKNAHMLPSFSKLQELNVSQNKISEIPSSILSDLSKAPAVIESLTILNFNRNRLVEIPEAFYKLCTFFVR